MEWRSGQHQAHSIQPLKPLPLLFLYFLVMSRDVVSQAAV